MIFFDLRKNFRQFFQMIWMNFYCVRIKIKRANIGQNHEQIVRIGKFNIHFGRIVRSDKNPRFCLLVKHFLRMNIENSCDVHPFFQFFATQNFGQKFERFGGISVQNQVRFSVQIVDKFSKFMKQNLNIGF